MSNGAVSLLFDGRSGQNTVGLNFNVNYSGMLGTAAATSTNPSIKFTGDTDTGLGRADANQLSLITGGVEAFRVTSTLISGSATSTGSFGRVQASIIGGNSPLTIESPTLSGNTDVDGNLTVSGDITAQNFIVSSSVTDITYQSLSGSSIFGDTADDIHKFTGSIEQTSTSTGSFGKIDGVNKAGGTLLRLGETQVAAGNNVGDAGARYVFNVDNHAPYVGIGVLQQNNTPHTISILNATYRSDGNFNYGFTLNQDNDG